MAFRGQEHVCTTLAENPIQCLANILGDSKPTLPESNAFTTVDP